MKTDVRKAAAGFCAFFLSFGLVLGTLIAMFTAVSMVLQLLL